MNLLEESIKCFKKAIEIDPKLADIYNNLGNAFKDINLFDEAMIKL